MSAVLVVCRELARPGQSIVFHAVDRDAAEARVAGALELGCRMITVVPAPVIEPAGGPR